MITMEFDEMKKIWDSQNNEPLYAINEEALHRSVKAKKNVAGRVVNLTELGLMLVNGTTSIILLIDAIVDEESTSDYIGAFLMMLTVAYIYLTRVKRKKSEHKFDRTILGELDHAIARTKSTIKLGSTMIWWYFLPICIWVIGNMTYKGASWEKWLLIMGAFILGFTVSSWEVRKIHVPRRKRLEALRNKLKEEGVES